MGALCALGIAYAVVRLIRAREWLYGYLLLGLPILTLSTTGSIGWPGENPSVFRAAPVIPLVYLLCALPLVLVASQVRATLGRRLGSALAIALVVTILTVVTRLNYDTYFYLYAEQYRLGVQKTIEMGAVLRGFAQSVGSYAQAYHVPWAHWVDTRSVGAQGGNPRWLNTIHNPADLARAAAGPTPQLYFVHPDDKETYARLRELRPDGFTQLQRAAAPNREFIVYFVPSPPDN
jgi:hypothetical protein